MWGPAPGGRTPWAATGSGCGGQGRPGVGTSYRDHHECHNSHGAAMGPSMDVTSAMGTKHRDKPWTWDSAQTGCGDQAWGQGMGTHSGAIRGVWPWAGGGQKHHPSVSPCIPWGCQSGCETPICVPNQAVSIVTRSPPCHPGPRGARGSVLPELSPFPVLPTRPLQGFALLVLHSLLLSPNSLFLPAASTAALGRRLGFLPLPSSPRPSSPFGCQM